MRSALHLASHRADQVENVASVPGRDQLPKQAIRPARLPPHSLHLGRVASVLPVGSAGAFEPLAFVGPCSIPHARGTGRPAFQVSRPAREDDESAGGRPRFSTERIAAKVRDGATQ